MHINLGFRAAWLGVALLLGAGLGGCTTNPATGESTLALMSWDQERALAAEAAPQFTDEFGGEVPDSQVQAYVQDVGRALTAVALDQAFTEVPDLEWEYTLLDSPVINAFALPGGKVYMSRGLAAKLNNEAQMAGILGHEIGHVIARHGNQRMSKQIGFNAVLAGVGILAGTADEGSTFSQVSQYAVPALAVGGNVVLLKYGRDEEIEADRLGIQYMVEVGYDPMAQAEVMEILRQAAQGAGAPPEWLSTHPAADTRIDVIENLIAEKYAYTQNSQEYRLYPERYRQRMLIPLQNLPPAQQQTMGANFDLANPVTWCGYCAHEAALAAR